MQAWVVERCAPIDEQPLSRIERELPLPGPGQVRVSISCCGVCRTDLHLAEGDLAPRHPRITPGHEIVGHVDARGPAPIGSPSATGWASPGSPAPTSRAATAGVATKTSAPIRLSPDGTCMAATPTVVSPTNSSPTGCRKACRTSRPLPCCAPASSDTGRCGPRPYPAVGGWVSTDLVAAAHLTAQIALHLGLRVHVLTRGDHNRQLAADLGVDSVGEASDRAPEPLDGAILFAPAGALVPVAVTRLGLRSNPGGCGNLAVGHPHPELLRRTVPRTSAA